MVKKINTSLLDVGVMSGIHGVVIHNDAGSGSAEWYVEWLRYRDKSLGIAHYYITRDCIARVIDTNKIGWHTGNGDGNGHYIGYEVCQSMSASDADFLANENMTLMQAAEDLQFYGLPVNSATVRLHHEFVPTTCPHRSMALHGNSTESVKEYFIDRIKHFVSLGKTVEEMLEKQNKPTQENAKIETKKEELEEEEMKNFVVRSKSGKQGYVAVVNGAVFGIGDISTVHQLQASGAVHLNLDDGDFERFLESQKFDDQKLVMSVDKLTEAISKQ